MPSKHRRGGVLQVTARRLSCGMTRAGSAGMVAAGVVLIAMASYGQLAEAHLDAGLLTLFGVGARWVGTLVFFTIGNEAAGIRLTSGCSVGPVLGSFCVLAGLVGWFRPPPLHRVLIAIVELVVVFALANQLRLLVIVFAMRRWGFQRGYDYSHVFVGSVITTTGFVLGVGGFVWLLLGRSRRAPVRTVESGP